MMLLRDAVGWLLIGGGCLFMVIGALGVLRMPDVFTRMHAASVSDTFGAGLAFLGMMVMGGFTLVTVKLLFLLAFVIFFGPIATHALARAALHFTSSPIGKGRMLRQQAEEEGEASSSKP